MYIPKGRTRADGAFVAQVSWASSLHAGAAPQVSVTEWPQKAARFIGGCVSSVLPWPLAPGIPRLPGGQIIPQRASCQSPTSQSAFSSRGVLLTPSVQGPQESPYRAPWFRSNVPLKGPEGTLCPRSWVCSTPDPARPAELWEATVCPTLGKGPQHPRATNPPPTPRRGRRGLPPRAGILSPAGSPRTGAHTQLSPFLSSCSVYNPVGTKETQPRLAQWASWWTASRALCSSLQMAPNSNKSSSYSRVCAHRGHTCTYITV